MTSAIISGAEPVSREGRGERGKTGILLVHGFTGNPASLRPLCDLLSERGFAVEMPLLPGHGTAPRDLLPFRYSDFRAEVAAALGRLRARTERVVLLGLSMGGTLVLDVASRESVAGVVTINAQILDRGRAMAMLAPLIEKVMPLSPASAAGLRKNDIKKGGDEKAYAWVAAGAGNSLLRALPELRARLKDVTCPLLVLYSRDDHSVPPASSRAIPTLVGSPNVVMLELENSYHVATLDFDLPLIEERVASFAESLGK